MNIECPQCGLRSDDLKDGAQPVLLARMGDTSKFACRICEYVFLWKEGDEYWTDEPESETKCLNT